MPVEERREPVHGSLTAAPCCRHPRQACPTPYLIPKLGIADEIVTGTVEKQVIVYARENAKEPFTEWLYGLRDVMGRKRILSRVSRLQGNYGDCEPVGEGVSELRMFFGSGYRVYFGERDNHIVVLLCGDDKGSQSKDIEQAKDYWKEYLLPLYSKND